ncbi:MAG TPA: hypothetical protein VHG93_27515 [Longimicrobium sp.]|nr:hypothetical protein [Longimicrobium sp.]
MRTTSSAILAFAVLFAAAPMDAAAQEDFRWSGGVPAGQRVEIKGVNGAIRAEPSTSGQVEVTAVKRRGNNGRLEDVRIERVMHDRGVTLCAIYPSARRNRPNVCEPGDEWSTNVQNNDVRVDWVVRVPRGVHFLGANVNGAVSALNMPADATVSTVNGAVTVSAAGVVEASTVNGNIDATTGRARQLWRLQSAKATRRRIS